MRKENFGKLGAGKASNPNINLLIYKQLTPKQKEKMAEKAVESLILHMLKETYKNKKQTEYTKDMIKRINEKLEKTERG